MATKLGTILSLTIIMTACEAQIKNAKTVTVKIDGNCGMCEETIEGAGTKKKISSVDWNKDTKEAILTFDATKTNADDLLKLIAYAGYDNEKFLAPDEAYVKLPECCHYERTRKKIVKVNETTVIVTQPKDSMIVQTVAANQFKAPFDAYFELKNALVKSDSKTATIKATDLLNALQKVDMGRLESGQHTVWMKVYKNLEKNAEDISKANNLTAQRNAFSKLANDMKRLAKVAKLENTIYIQHCPMYNDGKGADWLSTENTIKNPYYGSQMLTCGKTIETIKN